MKLFILQTVIPDYRGKFFTELKKRLYDDFEFACGDTYFEKSVKTDWSIKGISPIKNHYFLYVDDFSFLELIMLIIFLRI